MKRVESSYTVEARAALNAATYLTSFMAFISVAANINIIFTLSFAALFSAALYFDYKKRYKVYRAPLNIALLIFVVVNSLRISLDNFAAPIVETLLILLAVKLIEDKQSRDYLQIYILSVFTLTGSALMSLDISFLIILVIMVFLLPVSVALLTFHAQQKNMRITDRDLRVIISRSLMIAVISIPVSAFMFIILPRSGFPMLNILAKPSATTGFSEYVRLGEISDIQESGAVIMRVESPRVEPSDLYWRGIVLDEFDGKSWKSRYGQHKPAPRQRLSGKRIDQVVYLEPYNNRYLFALDKPSEVYYRNAALSSDLTISTKQNIDRLIRYSVTSYISDTIAQEDIDSTVYLRLPEKDYGRIRELVKRLTYGKKGEDAANAVMEYLKMGRFVYGTKNLPITDNPVEDFLFVHKFGNCEYFASSMAVMLRLAGIPSRLVGGYLGGQYNGVGNYYVVPQKAAHIWVEAYIQGKGWVRMDPTPEGAVAANIEGKNILWRLRLFFDIVNYYWNSVVIHYDLQKQVSLISSVRNILRSTIKDTISIKGVAPKAACAAIAAVFIALFLRFLLKRKSTEQRLVNRFVKKMKKRGYERAPSEGLEEFAKRVDNLELRDKALRFAREFNAVYYRDRKMDWEERRRLGRILDNI